MSDAFDEVSILSKTCVGDCYSGLETNACGMILSTLKDKFNRKYDNANFEPN
mgnify:CR=1 FL=1